METEEEEKMTHIKKQELLDIIKPATDEGYYVKFYLDADNELELQVFDPETALAKRLSMSGFNDLTADIINIPKKAIDRAKENKEKNFPPVQTLYLNDEQREFTRDAIMFWGRHKGKTEKQKEMYEKMTKVLERKGKTGISEKEINGVEEYIPEVKKAITHYKDVNGAMHEVSRKESGWCIYIKHAGMYEPKAFIVTEEEFNEYIKEWELIDEECTKE